MARKNVRVDIPVGNVDDTLRLGKKIIDKHQELDADAGSPLTGSVDMDAFTDLHTEAVENRTPAVADYQQKQAWNDQALNIIGIGAGQTLQNKGTVYWYINRVHKYLKMKFKNNEEQASLWGFDVVISEVNSRRHVRFNIPYSSPKGLLDLSSSIISKHTADGAGSILIPVIIDMGDFEAKHIQATELRDQAEDLDAESQAANQQARVLCGYGEGQNSNTPGTLYFLLTKIRETLLLIHDGNEEQLSTWGFNVVISETDTRDPEPEIPNTVMVIEGTVEDATSNEPLADVNIEMTFDADINTVTTQTDTEGNFEVTITNLTPNLSATATLTATKSGYTDFTNDYSVQAGVFNTVEVSMSQ